MDGSRIGVGMWIGVLLNAAGEVHGSISGIRIFWEDPCEYVHMYSMHMRESGVM
jgi:dynactin complex subunit